MGQRVNYVIKNGNNLTIHYSHWRAYNILADLYLGEQRFLKYVRECMVHEAIMEIVWIEGFVIVDIVSMQLHFFSYEFNDESSVVKYYLDELRKKWSGWQIGYLYNRMYDAEQILQIDYISKQELSKLHSRSKEDIIEDKVGEWISAVVIIIQGGVRTVLKTGNLDIDAVIGYGKEIVSLLINKPVSDLPVEDSACECVIVNVDEKKIFCSYSRFGLWEQSKHLWNEYNLTMGDFGYLRTLELAGISTKGLEMTNEQVIEAFNQYVEFRESYDPSPLAIRIADENNDVQFNPDFFDQVQPKRSLIEKLITRWKKVFSSK